MTVADRKEGAPARDRAKRGGESAGRRRQLVDAEIYNVATQLFSTKGYGSTSLQDIADAMGLSRPSLYHYVSSKEDILAKLIEEFTESRASELADVVSDSSRSSTAKLREIVSATVRRVAEHPQRFRLLDRCEHDLPEPLLSKHWAAKRAVRDAFVSVVVEGVGSGEFRAVDANTAAFALIGMCTWVAWWFTPTSAPETERVVASITDLALGTLAKAEGETQLTPIEALRSVRRQVEAVELQLASAAGADR